MIEREGEKRGNIEKYKSRKLQHKSIESEEEEASEMSRGGGCNKLKTGDRICLATASSSASVAPPIFLIEAFFFFHSFMCSSLLMTQPSSVVSLLRESSPPPGD